MKITKEKWKEIKKYVYDHSKEIWDLAVNHTDSLNDAIVWLNGISSGKYELSGMYTSEAMKHPDKATNSLIIYKLPRDWDVDLGVEECVDREEWENMYNEAYELGYELFCKKLHNDEFWDEMIYINKIEIEGWRQLTKKMVRRMKYILVLCIGKLNKERRRQYENHKGEMGENSGLSL